MLSIFTSGCRSLSFSKNRAPHRYKLSALIGRPPAFAATHSTGRQSRPRPSPVLAKVKPIACPCIHLFHGFRLASFGFAECLGQSIDPIRRFIADQFRCFFSLDPFSIRGRTEKVSALHFHNWVQVGCGEPPAQISAAATPTKILSPVAFIYRSSSSRSFKQVRPFRERKIRIFRA